MLPGEPNQNNQTRDTTIKRSANDSFEELDFPLEACKVMYFHCKKVTECTLQQSF